ncbi:17-beta-hydroxysteroid dehydrogenase type 1 isoform X1 [Aquila chrysaetos chrysaetos]|uniref:17-beta-hydroxysteroid dehydrogenase type 1 isoform X1 n=1 Tax=Aquila chrysaetos chrysaetos TaxID=223781 RepID=UPI0011772688|nr:17-beta-hydroxysteroid dehydrogenase type 1 isoform X1 [Aquila chrysaetos chrysaetos]
MEKTTVLITGCSSGIGLGLAARLAADTARRFKVYATMRDLAKGERLLKRLGGCCPDTLEVLQLDVTDPCSLAATAQRVQGQRLDVLAVCNAGVGLMGPLETCSDQAMKTIFDVNLFGAIRTIQAFLPAMKRRRAGRIIVSSSIGGLQGGTWPCCSRKPGTLWHGEPQGRDPVLRVRLCPRAALQLCVLRQQVCGGGAVREPGHRPAALQHPPDTGGVWTRQHQLPGQPAAPGPRGQRAAGPGRRDAWPLPPVPAALPEPLPRRGPGGGRGPAGVRGGHRDPLPSPALRHHPALRPAVAPAAGQPRRLRVRPGHARLRVRPR